MMVIIGAFFWSLFSVLGKKLKYEVFTSMFIYLLSGLVCTILSVSFLSSFVLPNLFEIIGSFYLGFFTMAIAFVTWFKALKMGEASIISNFTYLVPFVSLIFARIVLKEEIFLTSIFGLVLIITGILIQNIRLKN